MNCRINHSKRLQNVWRIQLKEEDERFRRVIGLKLLKSFFFSSCYSFWMLPICRLKHSWVFGYVSHPMLKVQPSVSIYLVKGVKWKWNFWWKSYLVCTATDLINALSSSYFFSNHRSHNQQKKLELWWTT